VQRSQASINRGQKATFVVQVSTGNNGSASGVTVTLTARPASQKAVFTGGCIKGEGTASCAVSSVTDKQPVSLTAQVPVAASASSVSSVTLTATASVVTTDTWMPPSAAETIAVTAAPASSTSSQSSASPSRISPATRLALGPIPNLNAVSSQLIEAGDASGLFPAISPSDTPSPSPESQPPAAGAAARPPTPVSSAISFVQPGLTGQVAGLVALALAVFLTVTRLTAPKRPRPRKKDSS
jgi:hypothetical protein